MSTRPKLLANLDSIAKKLGDWLVPLGSDAICKFDQRGQERFIWQPSIAARHLRTELEKYGDMDRRSTGIKDQPSSHAGTFFFVGTRLTEYGSMTERELIERSQRIATRAVSIFGELSFLYDLLRPPGTSRIGNATVDETRSAVKEPNKAGEVIEPPPPAPDVFEDARLRRLAEVVQREGQKEFRDALLRTFKTKCPVTGFDAAEVLEAAHIIPYLGPNSNHPANGVLLRADIHILFDSHLLSIDPVTDQIYVAPSLREGSYGKFHGMGAKLPRDSDQRTRREFLKRHYGSRKLK